MRIDERQPVEPGVSSSSRCAEAFSPSFANSVVSAALLNIQRREIEGYLNLPQYSHVYSC